MMKKFLFQVVLFSFITSLLIVGSNFITAKIINKKASFQLSKNIDKIIVGHSQPESAYNDSFITNLANVSQSGESYFYSYFKIKKILQQNSNIKYVFLEFTNNQIEEERELWIWGEETLSFRYPVYSPFIDDEGFKLIMRKNFGELLNLQLKSLVKNTKPIIKGNYDYIKKTGGYNHLVRDKTDSLLIAEKDRKEKIFNNKLPYYTFVYLDKIINLCKEQNVALYLIRSPLHPRVTVLNYEKFFQYVLKTRLSSVEFLDFRDFPLENQEFGDFLHLNYRGAKKYSIFFNEILGKGLLMNNNKQQFIDSIINTIKNK